MNPLQCLFKFPIVMVDGDNEDRKTALALPGDREVDIIIGEAECPYSDFISITDRWLPTIDSFNKALDGEFEACFVCFGTSGNFVVPWNKAEFKRKLSKFIEENGEEKQTYAVKALGKKDLLALANAMQEDEEEEDNGNQD